MMGSLVQWNPSSVQGVEHAMQHACCDLLELAFCSLGGSQQLLSWLPASRVPPSLPSGPWPISQEGWGPLLLEGQRLGTL